ncbi:CRISPR-associated endonuclease Cas1 [Aminithiophilus ramosus]|uniref:CRISPR-associated endonuclease Cas1 n=2 Tax=Synergistales TaxID=649776 RepID=A0A9Q7A7E6_9BACT|nr:CRISPR-associated endonuclease Cas1 [Aminithiophilus ramosus]QTX32146.1 CRISPR-associated endonuclease Cas1 [Aminithiophilus ramosus]QVL36014.1 CRISPR-associated endonuclease Cas1 [Synergistota bacterium]
MAQILCFERPVTLSRKNGTLGITGIDGTVRTLPLLQISELFALAGATVEPSLASLLAETRTPLHSFGPDGYEGSWMPFHGLLAGRTAFAQYRALCDGDRRRELGLRLLKAAMLFRLAWVRQLRPGEEEHWEERYLAIYREARVYPQRPLRLALEAVEVVDAARRQAWGLSLRSCRIAADLWLALTIGTFRDLSLDPWCSLVTEKRSFPLARDLAFLLEPSFVEAFGDGLPGRSDLWAPLLEDHLRRPFARDGGRVWSLRSLALREGYLLLGAIQSGGIYRPAKNVEVTIRESA